MNSNRILQNCCRWSRWPARSDRGGSDLRYFSRVASTRSNDASTTSRLDFARIDAQWQQKWARDPPIPRKDAWVIGKSYVLPMFPYPSGSLHLGHLRVYTIADVLARFKHMQGYDVIHPMGWDAFGLPAENAAIERGIDPAEWTVSNVGKMKEQLLAMNGSWDWSRELMTCDPAFYKHTQRIFLLLHERGLAYQDESLVNYDPVDRTVLANEQVDAKGFSWRSGAMVEKILLKQWFLRITEFKEALLDDLDLLAKDGRWPERVLSMQRNWIGKSTGATVGFELSVVDQAGSQEVDVFTTRLDTLFGVQYIALSLNHPTVVKLAERMPDLQAFIDTAAGLPPDSKDGFLLPGVTGRNPLTVLSDVPAHVFENIPVYAAPYVLPDYGSGAVMGVPGHDPRDYAFWKQNQPDKPIRFVVGSSSSTDSVPSDAAYTTKGILTDLCGSYSGLKSEEAADELVVTLQLHGAHAAVSENWRLRDWLISRQRYWGAPIPIIHCKSCGAVPVPEKDLPVTLPKLEEHQWKGRTGNPLEAMPDWINTQCPSCSGPARRETDTMDTFMDSSWYFFRFADPHNSKEPIGSSLASSQLPVDIYIGGVEHAILHLLYARFISKFLTSISVWPGGGGTDNKGEPFHRLLTQGMVHGKTFSDPDTGRFLKPDEVDLQDPNNPRVVATGVRPNISFEKMSKSKYNGVDPTTTIAKYGADVTRAHILFQAPASEVLEWEEDRIVGIQRWFNRIWKTVELSSVTGTVPALPGFDQFSDEDAELYKLTDSTAAGVTASLSSTFSLNTVISDLTKLTNAIASADLRKTNAAVMYHSTSSLIRMLAPVAPAFAEECWVRLHADREDLGSVFAQAFPTPDPEAEKLTSRQRTCAVQVNGKLRTTAQIPIVPSEISEQGSDALTWWVLKQLSRTEGVRSLFGRMFGDASEADVEGSLEGFVQKWRGRGLTKVIAVKGGKTINFVVKKTEEE